MKALVYTGPNAVEIKQVPKPTVQAPTDAVVRLVHTTICGTDLHILKGDVPTAQFGRILGHEGVGTIESLGAAVQGFAVGDNVLISCITACGVCRFCRKGMSSHCLTGGWILGNTIDGTQAEYVRIPHATASLYKLPADGSSLRAAVALSDSFPTGMECGTLNARVEPGKTVAIVGSGPVGLAAMMTARLYSPASITMFDLHDERLQRARQLGADHVVNSSNMSAALDSARALTSGEGFDAVIEAVGIPATFELCQELVAVGGCIANVGVHGGKVDLHLEKLWDRNISESFPSSTLSFFFFFSSNSCQTSAHAW